jgi:serine/threonine-protein phosphatase 2B catalytic subunit
VPKIGLFCDLVWADPVDNQNGFCESLVKTNNVRGCSYFFGF